MTIDPYFKTKAQLALHKAGANTDNWEPLATWAQQARKNDPQPDPDRVRDFVPQGVIITQNGDIVAQTFRSLGTTMSPGGTYVDRDTCTVDFEGGNELGLARSAIAHELGERLVHIKYSDVACGDGDWAYREAVRLGLETPMVTGDDVKYRRLALGLSQPELAAILDVKQQTISNYERDARRIPAWLLDELAAMEDEQDALTADIVDGVDVMITDDDVIGKVAQVRAQRALRRMG